MGDLVIERIEVTVTLADGSVIIYRADRPANPRIEAAAPALRPSNPDDPYSLVRPPGLERVEVSFEAGPGEPIVTERMARPVPLAEIVDAYRRATGWTFELARHYAQCDACTAICGHEEEDCADAPR